MLEQRPILLNKTPFIPLLFNTKEASICKRQNVTVQRYDFYMTVSKTTFCINTGKETSSRTDQSKAIINPALNLFTTYQFINDHHPSLFCCLFDLQPSKKNGLSSIAKKQAGYEEVKTDYPLFLLIIDSIHKFIPHVCNRGYHSIIRINRNWVVRVRQLYRALRGCLTRVREIAVENGGRLCIYTFRQ